MLIDMSVKNIKYVKKIMFRIPVHVVVKTEYIYIYIYIYILYKIYKILLYIIIYNI